MKHTIVAAVCLSAATLMAQTTIRKQFGTMTAAKFGSIPNFTLPDKYKDRSAFPLPASADNTKKQWFPPTGWSIAGWSCANATAISYAYDYQVQKMLKLPSSGNDPYISYNYTYHFLNSGDQAEGGDGWMFVEAFDIAKETGIPTTADFGGLNWGNAFGGWMSGYDKYYRAMKLRAAEYYKLDASVMSNEEIIKQYLFDHANGSPDGGLIAFQANSENMKKGTFDGKPIISALGGGGGHSMNVVGYDDAFNGGSYLVCNNWGDGLFWAKYTLFRAGAPLVTSQGTPFMLVKLREAYTPQLTLKVTLTHSQRNQIAIMTGVANGTTATAPTKVKDYAGAFNYAGGANPMVGRAQTSTIEIGLDLTDFVPALTGKDAKFFLQVVSKGGTGQINSVTLMDYTTGTVKEIPAAETNKAIASGATTLVGIPWTGTVGVMEKFARARADHFQSLLAYRNGEPVRIRATAEAATAATLNVRDLGGRPVFGGSMPLAASQGLVEFPWSLKNAQGENVAPGLYFATLELKQGKRTVQSSLTRIRVSP